MAYSYSRPSEVCNKWAEEVFNELPKIERRKDNRDIIDYPFQQIINSIGIADVCDYLEHNDRICEIYFTHCYYWPVLRDIMIFCCINKPTFYAKAIRLYGNNQTILRRDHSVQSIMWKASVAKENEENNRRWKLAERMEKRADAHLFDSALMSIFLEDYMQLPEMTAEMVVYEWKKLLSKADNIRPRPSDKFLSNLAYICDRMRKKFTIEDINSEILGSSDGAWAYFKFIGDTQAAINLLQWADTNECEIEIYNIREGLKKNFIFSMNEKKQVWSSSSKLTEYDADLFCFSSLDEVNVVRGYDSKECDVCHRKLERINGKIEINDEDGVARNALVQEISYCPICEKCYLMKADEEEIDSKINRMKRSYLRVSCDNLDECQNIDSYEDFYLCTVWESTMPTIKSDIFVNIENHNFYYKEGLGKPFVGHRTDYPWPVIPDVYSDKMYNSNVCSTCKEMLIMQRANLVIRNKNGYYEGTFVKDVHWCPKCKTYYITDEDSKRIEEEITTMMQKQILVDVNREYGDPDDAYEIHRDRGYLDLPVIDLGIIIDLAGHNLEIVCKETIEALDKYKEALEQWEKVKELYKKSGKIGDLNSVSFLKEMGYTSSKDDNWRHQVLDEAINRFGKRKIVDLLQFFINMRKGNQYRYTRAIDVWKEDIEYVIQS